MKFISTLLLCFTLLACSSTTVHLYSRYLSTDEISTIENKLTDLGFNVETNMLAFPDEVKQSVLVYSPFVENEQSLNTVIDSVSALGWKLSNSQMLKEGNHWYIKNNVGLFLVPEGARTHDIIAMQDLSNTYQSKDCKSVGQITLNSDASYTMSFEKSFNILIHNRTDFMKGNWKITAFPYVELKSLNNEWFFYFKIQSSKIVDNIGEVNIVELIPENNYTVLPKCKFAYGQRS